MNQMEIENIVKETPAEQQAIVRAILMSSRIDETKIVDDILKSVRNKRVKPHDIVYVDLSIDRSSNPLRITGSGTLVVAAEASDDLAELSISFEEADPASNSRIVLREGKQVRLPYNEIYIYHSAQAGKYMKLLRATEFPSLNVGIEDNSSESSQNDLNQALGNSSTFSTAQVAVDATADLIKAANSSRRRIVIKVPNTAAEPVFIGLTAAVTTSTGHQLDPGDAITLNTEAAIYGITASGSVTITYLEE